MAQHRAHGWVSRMLPRHRNAPMRPSPWRSRESDWHTASIQHGLIAATQAVDDIERTGGAMSQPRRSKEIAMNESRSNAYQLCFRSLFHSGRGYAFPCDPTGNVDLDAMSERARNN